jgi:ArsR family transcriptional regulator
VAVGAAETSRGSAAAPELAAVLAGELGEQGRGALFYYGAAPTAVLAGIASRARRVLAMNASRLEVQRARAALHSRGLSHCVLQQGELTSLPAAAAEYDVAIIDRTVAGHPRPGDALREVARLLTAGAELFWLEDYEAIAQRVPGSNPLATLRSWLNEAGLTCTRLHPIDVDGQHLVLAVAHTPPAITAAA